MKQIVAPHMLPAPSTPSKSQRYLRASFGSLIPDQPGCPRPSELVTCCTSRAPSDDEILQPTL